MAVILCGYAVLMAVGLTVYVALPGEPRLVAYLVIGLSVLPAMAIGLRRCPRGARSPLWLQLIAMILFDIGNVVWVQRVFTGGPVRGRDPLLDLLSGVGMLLLLAGTVLVVLRRGRRDVGGVIDAMVTAVALGGVLWDVLLLPRLTANGASLATQLTSFGSVIVTTAGIGALARVSMVSRERNPAIRLLVLAMVAALIGNLSVALDPDVGNAGVPDMTLLPFMVTFVFFGCAALHPSVARLTEVGAAPRDDLTPGRLAFLGLMTLLIPLVGGGRAVIGLPADGILIALGSTLVIPLVMLRISRLAAQRREAEDALRRMANTDALTGLPNRAACIDHVDAALAGLTTGKLAVLFCDLDGFKRVNDRLGHAAGDELLVTVAARLRGCVRAEDLVSRLGGDEFVIVCNSATIEAVCDRIRAVVAKPITVAGEEVRIGVSVGVSYADRTCTTDEVIGRADIAMYEAKRHKAVGVVSLATA